MYPDGFATTISVSGMSDGLCGAFRPGHFAGAATVVAKLLLQAGPDVALFGEKDYQQLQVIRRMVRDLDLPVAIVGVPTVREADGLAMSSRNTYLSPAERSVAPRIYRTLTAMAAALANGASVDEQEGWGRERLLADGISSIDYLDVRDAASLDKVDRITSPARVLVAVRLGKTRLIDNVAVGPLLAAVHAPIGGIIVPRKDQPDFLINGDDRRIHRILALRASHRRWRNGPSATSSAIGGRSCRN